MKMTEKDVKEITYMPLVTFFSVGGTGKKPLGGLQQPPLVREDLVKIYMFSERGVVSVTLRITQDHTILSLLNNCVILFCFSFSTCCVGDDYFYYHIQHIKRVINLSFSMSYTSVINCLEFKAKVHKKVNSLNCSKIKPCRTKRIKAE